jgi:hypothetical protein
MGIYEILKNAHSGWRYVVILLLFAAFITALSGYISRKEYTEGNRKLNVFALISTHIQLVLGLVLYFMNDWYKADSTTAIGRYWKMEHISIMLLAVILIHHWQCPFEKSGWLQAKIPKHICVLRLCLVVDHRSNFYDGESGSQPSVIWSLIILSD